MNEETIPASPAAISAQAVPAALVQHHPLEDVRVTPGSIAVEEAIKPAAIPERRPNVVVLEEPLKRGDQVITEVELRKPKSGALRGVKLTDLLSMDVDCVAIVLPRISSPTLTTADVRELDPVDLVALATVLGTFFVSKTERA
ncbi:phage tail assembly protein [Xanthomonas sp. 60]